MLLEAGNRREILTRLDLWERVQIKGLVFCKDSKKRDHGITLSRDQGTEGSRDRGDQGDQESLYTE